MKKKKKKKLNIVIPMGGLGSRFSAEGFSLPKPLIKANGKSLIEHSVETLGLEGRYIFITRKFEDPSHNAELSRVLKQSAPNSIEICIDKATRGAAETCLVAMRHINNDDPLIITNCDQRLEWDATDFEKFIETQKADGVIVTYSSDNPKNSFAVVDPKSKTVTKLVEKQAVSDIALIGLHYWKRGKYFVDSARKLLKDFSEVGRPECYISETYNYMLDKKQVVRHYHLDDHQYISLGTPYDLSVYLAKVKEFQTEKPKTIFCDIDGTLLHHVHRHSDVVSLPPKLLKGVQKKFDEWDSQGHRIILCSARKEAARELTEKQLKQLGLTWDYLVMGVTSGDRILINDKLHANHNDRAIAINVITNGGFENVKWDDYSL